MIGEYEPYFYVIYTVSTNKQNDLDVVEVLLHSNTKPGNKRPCIRTSKEILIKEHEFLTSSNNNISNIYHSMLKSSGGSLTSLSQSFEPRN